VNTRHSLSCFLRGLGLSLSKPYLAVSIWLIQLLLSSVLILPISNALHDLLDHSVAGSRMVAQPDYGWWETLQREHTDLLGNFADLTAGLLTPAGVKSSQLAGLRGLGATAVALAMLAVVLHAFALGGVFGTLREPQASLVTFGREGMRRFPAFLTFTLAALAAAGAAYRWIFLETGEALRGRVQELDTEWRALTITGLRLLSLLIALAVIKLVADSVRATWVARPDLPPVSRFFSGVAGFLSRPARLFGVLLWYVLVSALLYLVWLVADPSAGGEARLALVPLILTQQVFVFVRSLAKVGYYAGISEALTRAPSPEYSYVPSPPAEPAPESPARGNGTQTRDDEPSLDGMAGGI
jgi:hypothetical protein